MASKPSDPSGQPADFPGQRAYALDPQASLHLYLQLRNGLARLIRERRFSVDDALPSERVLAEQLRNLARDRA